GPNPLMLEPALPSPPGPPTQPTHAEIPAPRSVFPEIPLERPLPPPVAAPPPAEAAPPRPAPPAPPAKGAPPPESKSIRATVQRRLKEMLGLDAFEREVRAEPEAAKKPTRPGSDKKDVAPAAPPPQPAAPLRGSGGLRLAEGCAPGPSHRRRRKHRATIGACSRSPRTSSTPHRSCGRPRAPCPRASRARRRPDSRATRRKRWTSSPAWW